MTATLALHALLVACTADDSSRLVVSDGRVTVDVALNVAPTAKARDTRMAANAVVPETFYGVRDLRIVPFIIPADSDSIYKTSTLASGNMTGFEQTPAGTNSQHYLTEQLDLYVGTNAFLCYAQASPVEDEDGYIPVRDGNLQIPAADDVYAGRFDNVKFSLKPIQETHATDDAARMLNYLNAIAHAGDDPDVETDDWCNSADGSVALTSFKEFVNWSSGSPKEMAGSSRNVIAYVNAWYSHVGSLATIGASIQAAMHDSQFVELTDGGDSVKAIKGLDGGCYPNGLPDGGAVITWNPSKNKFEYAEVTWDETVGKYTYDGRYDKFTDYVYPARRYFYANSRIYTSNTLRQADYDAAASWNDVLAKYENKGDDARGTDVEPTTRSVAVKTPLSYGPAALQITIKANATRTEHYLLADDSKYTNYDDSKVSLDANTFPLTAIIVGSQVQQNYCFEPASPGDKSEKEYAIFDTQPLAKKTNGSETSLAAVCLGETNRNTPSAPVYTLGLQTKDELSLKVALEFENNSDKDFISENGTIYRGTKFYLVASVVPPGTEGVQKRVLTRGHITTVNLTIGSLKTAYNALPDLGSDKLRLFDTVEAGIRQWQTGETGQHEVHNW